MCCSRDGQYLLVCDSGACAIRSVCIDPLCKPRSIGRTKSVARNLREPDSYRVVREGSEFKRLTETGRLINPYYIVCDRSEPVKPNTPAAIVDPIAYFTALAPPGLFQFDLETALPRRLEFPQIQNLSPNGLSVFPSTGVLVVSCTHARELYAIHPRSGTVSIITSVDLLPSRTAAPASSTLVAARGVCVDHSESGVYFCDGTYSLKHLSFDPEIELLSLIPPSSLLPTVQPPLS